MGSLGGDGAKRGALPFLRVGPRACRRRSLPLLLSATVAVAMLSCRQKVLERPPGYIKIGKVAEFSEGETFRPDVRFLVIRDSSGIATMSTLCTYDLTPLRLKQEGNEPVLVSDYSSSRYSISGKVLQGPAVGDLPYYEAVVDSELIGGPRDTLYVHVGKKKSPDWRAPLPKITGRYPAHSLS